VEVTAVTVMTTVEVVVTYCVVVAEKVSDGG